MPPKCKCSVYDWECPSICVTDASFMSAFVLIISLHLSLFSDRISSDRLYMVSSGDDDDNDHRTVLPVVMIVTLTWPHQCASSDNHSLLSGWSLAGRQLLLQTSLAIIGKHFRWYTLFKDALITHRKFATQRSSSNAVEQVKSSSHIIYYRLPYLCLWIHFSAPLSLALSLSLWKLFRWSL